MSTVEQRKIIGCLRAKMALDEDIYREMLARYGVASSKDLTNAQAELLIRQLKQDAIQMGVWRSTKRYGFQKYKYNNEKPAAGMATPAQKRKIEAMWFEVSRQSSDEDRASALKTMIKRVTGKDHMRFLTTKDISALIAAMSQMRKEKRNGSNI